VTTARNYEELMKNWSR